MVENAGRNHSLQRLGKEQSLSVLQVILAAMADGRKLEPYVVFKGVHPVAALMATQGVVIAFSRNGWMNEAITNDWVTRVWGALNFQRRLLVWDAYRCHLMSSVSSHVEKSSLVDSLAISSLPMFLAINLSKKHTRCSMMSGWVRAKVLHPGRQHASSRQDPLLAMGEGSLEVCHTRSCQEVLSCLWDYSQH